MKRIVLAIVGTLAVILLATSFYVVQEWELAIVTRFGEYQMTRKHPGLYFKMPVFDTVTRMEKRVLSSDTPPAEYLTLDKKRMVADPVTRWRIKNALSFFKTVRDESGAKARIDDIVNSELRSEIASHEFGDIIGGRRQPLMDRVTEAARKKVEKFGIYLIDVQIKRADLPEEVQESVFSRMRAERDRIAKKYQAEGDEESQRIRAEADKRRSILLAEAYEIVETMKGEGDAQSTAIYAEAFGKDPEFYSFVRSLEAYEKAIDNKTSVVVSMDNEFLEHMKSRD